MSAYLAGFWSSILGSLIVLGLVSAFLLRLEHDRADVWREKMLTYMRKEGELNNNIATAAAAARMMIDIGLKYSAQKRKISSIEMSMWRDCIKTPEWRRTPEQWEVLKFFSLQASGTGQIDPSEHKEHKEHMYAGDPGYIDA